MQKIWKNSLKTLGINSDYSKIAGHKINTQKLILSHLPAINKQNLTLKHNTIYIWTLKGKYLGINLTKQVQDLYEENYKTLIKNYMRDIAC